MASSLSNLVDNFAKITHEMKSKYEHHHENVKRVELNKRLLRVLSGIHKG